MQDTTSSGGSFAVNHLKNVQQQGRLDLLYPGQGRRLGSRLKTSSGARARKMMGHLVMTVIAFSVRKSRKGRNLHLPLLIDI
jgi:hypothetical protein